MRLKNRIIKIIFTILILSGIVLVYLEFFIPVMFEHYPFYLNLAMSIFGSSLLLIPLSLAEYYYDKRVALEEFCVQSSKIMRQYLKIRPYDLDNSSSMDIQDLLYQYISVSEITTEELSNAYARIDFLIDKKTQIEFYNTVYREIMDTQNELVDIAFHFKEYDKNSIDECVILKYYLPKAQRIFFKGEINVFNDYMVQNIINIKCHRLLNSIEKVRCYTYKITFEEEKPIIVKTKYVNLNKNEYLE